MNPTFCTIITDCKDNNASARQVTRAASLLDCPVYLAGVSHELEAAGTLVDVLDASEGRPGVVLVNVAPRNGKAKKWKNGTPFGYFFYKDTLIVSSIDGVVLSLANRLGLIKSFEVFDIPTVMKSLISKGIIEEELANAIINTQFRSFEFVPRVASWIIHKFKLPTTTLTLEEIPTIDPSIWFIDNFGNCKTTILSTDIESIKSLSAKLTLTVYDRLKDVPDQSLGIVSGSSGVNSHRFIEIVCQGGNASQSKELQIGLL